MYALNNLLLYYNNCFCNDVYNSVAETILKNLSCITQFSTIYDLADLCHVSTATISRFCQKLGYSNYNDFKNDMLNALESHYLIQQLIPLNKITQSENATTYLSVVSQNISQFSSSVDLHQLENIVDYISEHKLIHIYTHGVSVNTLSLQADLTFGGKHVKIFDMPAQQVEDAKKIPGDALVLLTLPNVTERNLHKKILTILTERSIDMVILTNSCHSDYIKYSEYTYAFDGLMILIDDFSFSILITVMTIIYRQKYLYKHEHPMSLMNLSDFENL